MAEHHLRLCIYMHMCIYVHMRSASLQPEGKGHNSSSCHTLPEPEHHGWRPGVTSQSLTSSHASRKARGRHGAKYTEEMEDADLLKDEAGGAEVGHRLSQQPSVIKHGVMREYQMQGLNWLIHLYDNGINGILADEMARTPAPPLPGARSGLCDTLRMAQFVPLCRSLPLLQATSSGTDLQEIKVSSAEGRPSLGIFITDHEGAPLARVAFTIMSLSI